MNWFKHPKYIKDTNNTNRIWYDIDDDKLIDLFL